MMKTLIRLKKKRKKMNLKNKKVMPKVVKMKEKQKAKELKNKKE